MKRVFAFITILFLSQTTFSLSCKNFGITISNDTTYNCELRSSSLLFGNLFSGSVPTMMLPGSKTQTFYLYQDTIGAGIYLDYRCDNKIVAFYSGMNSCGLIAGDIGGHAKVGNDLNAEYTMKIGSSWSKRPGEIMWRIFN